MTARVAAVMNRIYRITFGGAIQEAGLADRSESGAKMGVVLLAL